MWQQWLTALLGLWTIVVPFTGMTGNALTWTLAITGILVAILGVWSATMGTADEYGEHERQLQHR